MCTAALILAAGVRHERPCWNRIQMHRCKGELSVYPVVRLQNDAIADSNRLCGVCGLDAPTTKVQKN